MAVHFFSATHLTTADCFSNKRKEKKRELIDKLMEKKENRLKSKHRDNVLAGWFE